MLSNMKSEQQVMNITGDRSVHVSMLQAYDSHRAWSSLATAKKCSLFFLRVGLGSRADPKLCCWCNFHVHICEARGWWHSLSVCLLARESQVVFVSHIDKARGLERRATIKARWKHSTTVVVSWRIPILFERKTQDKKWRKLALQVTILPCFARIDRKSFRNAHIGPLNLDLFV